MPSYTLKQLQIMDEKEDRVEFKAAKNSFTYASKKKSVLGYLTALANEGGGLLVLGMADKKPHKVVGSNFREGQEGQLEQDIYRDTKMRAKIQALKDNQGKRVLVIEAPKRPVGKPLYHNDIPLMRVGDALERMSEEMYISIIQEQEPDFSAKICEGLSIKDLDAKAINTLKEKYSQKRSNQAFLNLSNDQILSDLGLVQGKKITYAALILVGKEEALKKQLPQAEISFEYRSSENQIPFDKRDRITKPLFTSIEILWSLVDARNKSEHHQIGPYIYDTPPYFNEEVIREALLNAIAHRDYSINSEILIKQYPRKINVVNPGGLPKGVTLENIIKVNSTPRNRLLSEILEKTGLVERSGQGVDKMYRISITEGKDAPDYAQSDPYQVSVILNGEIRDHAFAQFLKELDEELERGEKLSVFDIINLTYVRDQHKIETISEDEINNLLKKSAVRRDQNKIILAQKYATLKERIEGDNETRILKYLEENPNVRMGELVSLFENRLTRRQVNNTVYNLVNQKLITKKGSGAATVYKRNG